MPRPRKEETPQGYLNAADVLPYGLLKSAIEMLTKKRVHVHRILTFSQVRVTNARHILGEHLYLGICAVMQGKSRPGETSWRLYFPRAADPVNYAESYALAASLMQRGYSRRVAAIVAGVAPASVKRHVDVAYAETQSQVPVDVADVELGYRYLIKADTDLDAAASTLMCGLVGRALREVGRAET